MGKRGPKPKLPLPGEKLSWRRKQALIKEYSEEEKTESIPVASVRPVMPDFLSLEGKEVWEFLTPHLELDVVASYAFASYCQWQGRVNKYERIIAKKGEIHRTSNGWTIAKEFRLLKEATSEALKLYDKLGLSTRHRVARHQRQEEVHRELSEIEKRRQNVLKGREPLTEEERKRLWILDPINYPRPKSESEDVS